MRRWVLRAVAVVGLASAAWWAHSPALDAPPVWEDRWDWGPETSPIRWHGNTPVIELGTRQLGPWTLSLQARHSPRARRVANLSLHALVCALAFALLRRLGASEGAAWAGTSVVALNAMAVQAIAYVASGRGELLAGAAVLGVCLAWSAGWRLTAVALLAAGLAAKQTAIAAIPLALAVDAAVARRLPTTALATASAAAVATAVLVGNTLDASREVSWHGWVALQATAAYRHGLDTIVPVLPQAVDVDYDALPPIVALTATATLALVVIVGVAVWRRAPCLGLGVLWLPLAMWPRLAIQTPHSELNGHQWYLPMLSIAWIVAHAWDSAPAVAAGRLPWRC